MASQLLPISALLFSTAFLLAANGMHSLLLPLRGAAEGFTTVELGLLGTGWAAGFVLGCLTAPVVVRRVGHIRAFACSAACASSIALLNALVVEPHAWMLFRALSGFFLAGAFMVIESWLNERATNESRGTIFAVYLTVTYSGYTAGQLGVGLGDPRTQTFFMICAILFAMATLPTALSTAKTPTPLARARLDLRKLFRTSPVSFVAVTMAGVINGAFGTLAAVYGTRIGLSTAEIALMMGLTVVSGALTQLPAGRLSDRTDRRYIIAGAAIGSAAAGLTILNLQPTSPALVLALTAIYGGLTYPIYGLAVAQANDYTEPGEFVSVSGGLLLLYGCGTIVGPLAAGIVMTSFKPEGLFAVTAMSHIIVASYAIYRTTRRKPIPESIREAFQTLPSPRALTPQTSALDPRSEFALAAEPTRPAEERPAAALPIAAE